MALGERGGFTATKEQGFDAISEFKATISDQHRDDLRIPLSAADKNVLGAVVNGLIRSGRIVETGERRKSSDPASHARKSNVYRLMVGAGNSQVGTEASVVSSPDHVPAAGGIDDPPEVSEVSTVTRVPSENEAQTLGEVGDGAGSASVEPARLFDVSDDRYRDAA